MYLSVTQPDLTYSIYLILLFMKKPKEEHWEAALHVVQYLKGILGQGFILRADSPFHLTSWCNSDWLGCPLGLFLFHVEQESTQWYLDPLLKLYIEL